MRTSTTKVSRSREVIYTVISVTILLAIWKMASLAVGKEIIIPSPENAILKVAEIVKGDMFALIVWNTVKRSILGFTIAMTLAITLGMSAGFFSPIYYLLKPMITLYRAMPTMAIILLAIIWLKSERAPVLVGFLVVFPILYENVVHGIRNVDKKILEMGKLYGLGKLAMIKDIYLPSMRGYFMTGASTAMGLNLKVIIAAEVLSQPSNSMGTSFYIERANLNTTGVFAWSLLAILIAGIMESAINIANKKLR